MACISTVEIVSYNMSKLARILRIARAESGLRNKEIANIIGVSAQTVSGHLAKQNSHVPDVSTLKKYSELFSIPLMKLLEAVDEEENEEQITKSVKEKLKVAEDQNDYNFRGDIENFFEIVTNYMRSLDDEERILFLKMLLDKIYKDRSFGIQNSIKRKSPKSETNHDR